MNWEQSCKDKVFCRAFSNFDVLLGDLDIPSPYPSASRCVAPPKSVENAHIALNSWGNLGIATLNQARLRLTMFYQDYGILGELVLYQEFLVSVMTYLVNASCT